MPRVRLKTRLPNRTVFELARIELTGVEDQLCPAFKSARKRQQAEVETDDQFEPLAFERGSATPHGARPFHCLWPADAMVEPQSRGVSHIVYRAVPARNCVGAQIDEFDPPIVRRRQCSHCHPKGVSQPRHNTIGPWVAVRIRQAKDECLRIRRWHGRESCLVTLTAGQILRISAGQRTAAPDATPKGRPLPAVILLGSPRNKSSYA